MISAFISKSVTSLYKLASCLRVERETNSPINLSNVKRGGVIKVALGLISPVSHRIPHNAPRIPKMLFGHSLRLGDERVSEKRLWWDCHINRFGKVQPVQKRDGGREQTLVGHQLNRLQTSSGTVIDYRWIMTVSIIIT